MSPLHAGCVAARSTLVLLLATKLEKVRRSAIDDVAAKIEPNGVQGLDCATAIRFRKAWRTITRERRQYESGFAERGKDECSRSVCVVSIVHRVR